MTTAAGPLAHSAKCDARARREMLGARFGRLRVVAHGERPGRNNNYRRFWWCICDCGNLTHVRGTLLRRSVTKSCGCLKRDINRSHGHAANGARSAEYMIWSSMIGRCTNARGSGFADYGGRGVRVCSRWLQFENFLADMGTRPSSTHSLDRIDNDGDYEPGNCRWGTSEEQSNNKRSNRLVTIGGRTMTATQWARTAGANPDTVRSRLRRGWPEAEAVFGRGLRENIDALREAVGDE